MNEPAKTCSYPGCGRAVYRSLGPTVYPVTGKCIFHAEEKDPQEFRNALARLIREWRKTKAEIWDFTRFIFTDREENPNMFRHALFSRTVYFIGTIFKLQGDFFLAVFTQPVYFAHAIFEHKVSFESTTFQQYTCFMWATFLRDVSFRGTYFLKNADFLFTVFSQDADLQFAWFAQDASFENARIGGCFLLQQAQFSQTEPNHVFNLIDLQLEQEGILDFRKNKLNNNCSVVIRNCNLGRILFVYTDVRQIQFDNISFEQTKDKLFKIVKVNRQTIGDEWILRNPCRLQEDQKAPWPDVEITYQRFAKVFRDSYNHPVANDCERGYFEARRNAARDKAKIAWICRKSDNAVERKEWFRQWFRGHSDSILIALYKHVSHYSGNLLLPVFWLLLTTLLIWPLCYHVFMPAPESFTVALRVASLSREPISLNDFDTWDRFWTSFIVTMQLITTAAFATLFILALRRRFKHGE